MDNTLCVSPFRRVKPLKKGCPGYETQFAFDDKVSLREICGERYVKFRYVFTQPFHHRQYVTRGHFLSRIELVSIQFSFSLTASLSKFKDQSALLFTHRWRENRLIHAFPKSINPKCNVNSLIQDLNSGHRFHFYEGNCYTKCASIRETKAEILLVWTFNFSVLLKSRASFLFSFFFAI